MGEYLNSSLRIIEAKYFYLVEKKGKKTCNQYLHIKAPTFSRSHETAKEMPCWRPTTRLTQAGNTASCCFELLFSRHSFHLSEFRVRQLRTGWGRSTNVSLIYFSSVQSGGGNWLLGTTWMWWHQSTKIGKQVQTSPSKKTITQGKSNH